LRQGVDLPEGRTAPAEVEVVHELPAALKLSKGPTEGVWLRIVLREGKKRQIRQMTAAVGYPTLAAGALGDRPAAVGRCDAGTVCPAHAGRSYVRLRRAVGLESKR
jgi:hypothetical protein